MRFLKMIFFIVFFPLLLIFSFVINKVIFFIILLCAIFLISYIHTYSKQKEKGKIFQKEKIKSKVTYFQDIPFDNLEIAFWVGTYYGIIENFNNFIGAMLLKWLKEDKIDILENNGKTILDFKTVFKTELGFESDIYVKLLASAGKNRLLEEKEFQKFFQNNEEELIHLFYKLKKETEQELIKQGLITYTNTSLGAKKIIVSKELKQKADELQGLKNFLSDVSIIDKKESIQVYLWDEYLIYAQLFGIAEQVEKEFKQIYPNNNQVIKINTAKICLIKSIIASLAISSGAIGLLFIQDR